jgi:hypothetical protein
LVAGESSITIVLSLSTQDRDWLATKFQELKDLIMANTADLNNSIAAANAEADAAISRVQTTVTSLKSQIADLETQVAAGNVPQATLDQLDALRTKLAALDPTDPSVLPNTPPAPEPAPTPAG